MGAYYKNLFQPALEAVGLPASRPAKTPYRTIAARLNMSYGSLQQSVRRLRGEVEERARIPRVPQHRSRFDRSSDERW
jgi:hypothetical protein